MSERKMFELKGDCFTFDPALVKDLEGEFGGEVLYLIAFGKKDGNNNTTAALLTKRGGEVEHYQHGEERRRLRDYCRNDFINSIVINIVVTEKQDFIQVMGLVDCPDRMLPPCPSHAISKYFPPPSEEAK